MTWFAAYEPGRASVGPAVPVRRGTADDVPGCLDLAAFANARNQASLDLHTELGFVEVIRDFWFPALTFDGGWTCSREPTCASRSNGSNDSTVTLMSAPLGAV